MSLPRRPSGRSLVAPVAACLINAKGTHYLDHKSNVVEDLLSFSKLSGELL